LEERESSFLSVAPRSKGEEKGWKGAGSAAHGRRKRNLGRHIHFPAEERERRRRPGRSQLERFIMIRGGRGEES